MQVPLVGLHGDLVLHVEAVDKNGRASSVTRRLRESTAGPELQILSPADHSVFTDTVSVQGAVSLPAEGASGDVKKLSWRAIGKPSLAGDVALSKDGSFDFSVSTRGITDDLVLELTAEDGNGHIAVKAITLLHPPAPVQTPARPRRLPRPGRPLARRPRSRWKRRRTAAHIRIGRGQGQRAIRRERESRAACLGKLDNCRHAAFRSG